MKGYLAVYMIKDKKLCKELSLLWKKQVNLERNKIFHLEDSVVMYGIYNAETIEKMINMIQNIHSKTTWNERLFAGKLNNWYYWYLYAEGAVHFAIN